MHAVVFALALAAAPFWELKPAREWTNVQIQEFLSDSPWARTALAETGVRRAGIRTYLSSALPVREAESEVRRRSGNEGNDDYLEFLEEDKGKSIILTVEMGNWQALADGAESKAMEEECVMKIGRRKYKMSGHFPPTPSDPRLRIVFPRPTDLGGKTVLFELYLPGVDSPFREAEYSLKEMTYRGKLEI